jgi:L-asparagine transporter-like permease
VEELRTAIDSLLGLLTQFGVALAATLTAVELWLREQPQHLGVPHTVQTLVLVTVAAVLVLGSLRLFAGLIRVAAVLILVLIAIHIVAPVIQG